MPQLGVVNDNLGGPLGANQQGPNIGSQNPGVAPDPVTPAQPTVGSITQVPPPAPVKKNYTTYIIIGIVVLVLAYIAYKYYKK